MKVQLKFRQNNLHGTNKTFTGLIQRHHVILETGVATLRN